MGNLGLLQETPDIATLRQQGGDHCEQPAAAEGSGGGLNALLLELAGKPVWMMC